MHSPQAYLYLILYHYRILLSQLPSFYLKETETNLSDIWTNGYKWIKLYWMCFPLIIESSDSTFFAAWNFPLSLQSNKIKAKI